MNFSSLITLMSTSNDHSFEFTISYSIIALLVLLIVFIVLVNKKVIMKNSNNKFKRFITNPLFVYSLKRIASATFSIVVALAITFCLIRMQDLETLYCSELPSSWYGEQRERACNTLIASVGLNKPLIVQFFEYLYNILPIPKNIVYTNPTVEPTDPNYYTYDFVIVYFGQKIKNNAEPLIWNDMLNKMPVSFKWGAIATIIQIVIGYPLGILMAKYQDKLVDKIGKAYVIFVTAVPGLLYYYLFFTLFYKFDNFLGRSGINLNLTSWNSQNAITWIAPAVTSAFAGIAGIAYWVRRYMLDEINSDYVKYARAKGLSENKIMFKHVLRNAIVPLSRGLSTAFISCLFGSYFIENLFGIPGFGGMLVESLSSNDFMVIQGVVVVSAIISVVSYLIADITMAIMDPRISFESSN